MSRSHPQPNWLRRILLVAIAVIILLVVYALVYQWVMATYEGHVFPFPQALQKVVEAITTAGFGGHAPWDSTQANLLVIAINLTGVALVFMALPVFVFPLLRELVIERLPRSSNLTGHVVVCGYSNKDEVLRHELQRFSTTHDTEIPFLYIEPDEETVRSLRKHDVDAMVGNPGRVETLRAANVEEAKAVVADVDDETNPSVILATRVIDDALPVFSVVRDHRVARHHRYAGATRVISARQSFARSLAMRVSGSYACRFRDIANLQEGLDVTEIVIEEGSPLVGRTLREASFDGADHTSSRVIAAWVEGKFLISPPLETAIQKNSILVVCGPVESLPEMGVHRIPATPNDLTRVIVAGFGQVGRGVVSVLEQTDIETTVIDLKERRHSPAGNADDDTATEARQTDIVGDITDIATLRRADIDRADAVVLLLDDDIAAVYATILINKLAPDVQILGRAQEGRSISTLYRAGADFILSLDEVTGNILAGAVLEFIDGDKDFFPASAEFELTRVHGEDFENRRLSTIKRQLGGECTVVAIERDGRLVFELAEDLVVNQHDTLIVAGSKDAVEMMRVS